MEEIIKLQKEKIRDVQVINPKDNGKACLSVQLHDGTFLAAEADTVEELRYKVSEAVWNHWYNFDGIVRNPKVIPNFIKELLKPGQVANHIREIVDPPCEIITSQVAADV